MEDQQRIMTSQEKQSENLRGGAVIHRQTLAQRSLSAACPAKGLRGLSR